MTIFGAITEANKICPNTYDDALKVKWLSRCESMIHLNIIQLHEDAPAVPFAGFVPGQDMQTSLIAGEPFDEIYVYYLLAQIHFSNDEISKYNNCITMFNNGYTEFSKEYSRKHQKKKSGSRFLF